MIELGPDVWVYGMWFVQGDKCDYLACVRKVEGLWRLDYRFRYYNSDKAFDSDDEKHWYSAEAKDESSPIEPLIEACHKVAAKFGKMHGTEPDFLLLECQGDDPKIAFQMGMRECVHMKTVTKEEARELGLPDRK